METLSFSDDVRRYIGVLWHWAWLWILAFILIGSGTFFVSSQLTPVYQASTSILINEAPTTKSADYNSILTNERLTQTYSQLLTKQPALDGVIQVLGLDLTVRDLKAMISVQPVRDTQLIEIQVEDTDPLRAALIANALVMEFARQNQALQSSRYQASKESLEKQLDQIDQQIQQASAAIAKLGSSDSDLAEKDRLQAFQAQYRQTYVYLLQSYEAVRLAEAQSTSNVVQAEPAVAPTTPIRPRVLLNTALASIVGLLLAIGAVFLIEALDDTLRNPEDISRRLGVPILGLIARHQMEDRSPVVLNQPRTPVAEAFRSLRTNIQFTSVDRSIRSLLVTSPSPGDGKSTIALNLAAVVAQNDRRVVVLDADLRRPLVHKAMHLPNLRGVSDLFVQSSVMLNDVIQQTSIPSLQVITSGNLPPNPSELLGSEKMGEIMHSIQTQADLLVIDTPPVLAVTDAAVLSPRVDGVILVVRPGATKLAACKQTVDQIRQVGGHVLGVVLNDVEISNSRYYYYYHYKGYYYTYYGHYTDTPNKGRKWPFGRSKKPSTSVSS